MFDIAPTIRSTVGALSSTGSEEACCFTLPSLAVTLISPFAAPKNFCLRYTPRPRPVTAHLSQMNSVSLVRGARRLQRWILSPSFLFTSVVCGRYRYTSMMETPGVLKAEAGQYRATTKDRRAYQLWSK